MPKWIYCSYCLDTIEPDEASADALDLTNTIVGAVHVVCEKAWRRRLIQQEAMAKGQRKRRPASLAEAS